jgi:nucleoside-diphosphate-sugar epimerase
MTTTYLVLGSAGQIGSALSAYLRKAGHNVIEFDIASNAKEDLRVNAGLLARQMRKADFVFFLAFDVGGARYLKTYQHSFDFISNNVKIMNTVFDALKEQNKPFIFASSQMANMSHSPYGVLKALGDFYTRVLGGLMVKFWNVYGIETDSRKFHAITDFVVKAQSEGCIKLLTTGVETRQFLYSEDCSAALYVLAQPSFYKTAAREENLHVTSFEWRSITDVAAIVAQHFGVPVIPGDQEDSVQRFHKNEPDPGILKYWKPTTSLEDGIKKVIDAMGHAAPETARPIAKDS